MEDGGKQEHHYGLVTVAFMCGIIGYFAKGKHIPERTAFERAMDGMAHRGPDGRGIWIQDQVGLGFRRLSVIDLKTGSQPMANEDGSLHLVFNGEIYNFKEIRNRLERKGHCFRTQSDTEVILHLYEEEGEDCVASLRGMFAFAVYDKNKDSLFLARDRFGEKPLVYSETPTGFYFASEMSALLHLADCNREVHPDAIDAYLSLRYVPDAYTTWKNIHRLPAASMMRVRHGIAESSRRYWRLDGSSVSHKNLSEQEALEGFRERFEESVRLRMIADVPVGAFLSGGVDSSMTVAAMKRLGGKVKTFCMGFQESRFDESSYAREIAQRLETDHHEIQVKADSLDALDLLVDRMGEPFADQSLLPTYLLSQFTRQHVTVALSGDGGDEFFGGYKRYAHLKLAALLKSFGMVKPWLAASRCLFWIERQFNPSRRKLNWPRSAVDQILALEPFDQYLHLVECWRDESRKSLQKHKTNDLAALWLRSMKERHPNLTGSSPWQALDVETYLIDDILRKVDTASMACSLECRCPLLDHSLAEFVVSLPSRFNTSGTKTTKILLKKLYPDLLPPRLFERKKKGFSMPIGQWMRRQWKGVIQESIEGKWSEGMESYFNRKVLQRLWQDHQDEKQDHGERLWTWFVLYRWGLRYKPNWTKE